MNFLFLEFTLVQQLLGRRRNFSQAKTEDLGTFLLQDVVLQSLLGLPAAVARFACSGLQRLVQ